MLYAYNDRTWNVETGRSEVQSHTHLPVEFKDTLDYIKPCIKI